MRREPGVLIATLGTKPQVVTTAADLLLSKGHAFSDVLVLHVGGERAPLASALSRLRDEFAAYPPYHSLTLQLQALAGAGGALPDVETQVDAEAAFRAIYRAVLNAKRAGQSGTSSRRMRWKRTNARQEGWTSQDWLRFKQDGVQPKA